MRVYIGTLFKVAFYLDASWIVLSAVFLYSGNEILFYGLAGVLAFCGVHEFAHIYMAKSLGVRSGGITFFPHAAMADIDFFFLAPINEVLIAIVGPIVSLALAFVFLIALGFAEDQHGFLLFSTVANFTIAIVSIFPSYPMDCGRLVRAALHKTLQDYMRATTIAARFGQVLSIPMIGLFFYLNFPWIALIFVAMPLMAQWDLVSTRRRYAALCVVVESAERLGLPKPVVGEEEEFLQKLANDAQTVAQLKEIYK